MNFIDSSLQTPQIVELRGSERWKIYRRLQELEIPCQCAARKPLRIEICDSQDALQLWCVVRHLRGRDRDLRSWLERCWQHP